ncbi:MAG: hypothetical protein K2N42_04795, partial [Anaeroplasmataceae bacterium]|nr:hypothetical protein [Anaeroplasmataceae bacterium]
DYNERKDLTPYAYDCIYLEYLDEEAYHLVKQASVHEKSVLIDVFYWIAIVFYFVYLALTLGLTIYYIIEQQSLENLLILCGALWGGLGVYTGVLPLALIQYRKFKAQ